MAALIPAVFVSSCASMMHGGTQQVNITSTPKAWVRIYNQSNYMLYQEKTPVMATLSRSSGFFQPASYRVEVLRQGYKKFEFWITGGIDVGWYVVGNAVLGGWLGWLIVDPMTGAMWTLSPDYFNAELKTASLSEKEGALAIILREDVPEKVMAQAVRLK